MFNKIKKNKNKYKKIKKFVKDFFKKGYLKKVFTKKKKKNFVNFVRQILLTVAAETIKILKLLTIVMVKTIEMRYFRPVAAAILVVFLLINVTLYIRALMINAESNFDEQRQDEIIEIRVLDDGMVVDVDEVQIFERVVESGDTVLGFLFDVGVDESEIVEILSAMKKKIDPREIVVGNSLIAKYKVKFKYSKDGSIDNRIVYVDEFRVIASPELEYVVAKPNSKSGYKAKKVVHEFAKRFANYKGVINDGLFVDATKAGASANAVMNMIALYGYDVDFQRDLRGGDEFEMVVESYYNKGGKKVKDGNVLFARLDLANKKDIAMYAHRMKNGSLQYFDKKGYSVKKSLLKTPINGARVSSRFGMRRHPVLGYSKLHKGVDFAARRGTPIFAAGDGRIVYRGRYGGYGNYIKIKHNSTYQTAYAHMSEVLKKGRAINPSRVKAVSGTRLKGKVLKDFKKTVKKIEKYRNKKKG